MLITRDDGQKFIWSIVEDITNRKRIAADLKVAATALDAQICILVTDANNKILKVNRAFTEVTGYTADEALGQTPRLFQSGRHDKDFYRTMWECINRTGSWQGEVWDRRKNGEEYPKWLTVTAVKDDDGMVTHYIGAHHDITERKKADEALREKMDHIEEMNKIMIGRELRVIEMKKEVNELARELGREPKYDVSG